MIFSSPTFLFVFLPCAVLLYACSRASWRHGLLFVLSLLFYSWGNPTDLAYLLVSILFNFVVGKNLERRKRTKSGRIVLALGIILNLGGLGMLKYASFIAHPPLGISFFTLHAMSYIIDISRGTSVAEKSLTRFGLYVAFFPQLLMGPVMRYREFAPQLLTPPRTTLADMDIGLRRFILGLAKKTILADRLAQVADPVFAMPPHLMSPSFAWVGLIAYTLQIYFDFSGYADMAVGLGRMFGLRLSENFRTPYAAASFADFWRRWHMSLIAWLREYVYIPLGGSRVSALRTSVNIVIVFLLSGLWHGVGWHFVVWGLYCGVVLVVERYVSGHMVQQWPYIIRVTLTLLLVAVGWVMFRSPDLSSAVGYLAAMAGRGGAAAVIFARNIDVTAILVVSTIALVAEMAIGTRIVSDGEPDSSVTAYGRRLGYVMLLVLSIGTVASMASRPFLYLRF